MERNHNKGFTLIEVLVSMAILVVVAAVLMAGTTGAFNVNKKAKDITVANYEQTEGLDAKVLVGTGHDSEFTATVTRSGKSIPVSSKSFSYVSDTHIINGFVRILSEPVEVEEEGGDDPGELGDFNAGEDPTYPVETWGDLAEFDPANNPHAGQGGGTNMSQTINGKRYGVVIYYEGDYYYVRRNPWVSASSTPGRIIVDGMDMTLEEFINYGTWASTKYCVKINRDDRFTTPGPNTMPGDQKLVDGIPYVFFPYDYYTPPVPQWYYSSSSFWFKLPPLV